MGCVGDVSNATVVLSVRPSHTHLVNTIETKPFGESIKLTKHVPHQKRSFKPTLECILLKLDTHIVHDERMYPMDFQGQRSKAKVTHHSFIQTWSQNVTWSQRPLPIMCFSGRSKKQDGFLCIWLAETFLTSPLKLLNGIQRNLTGSKISMSTTKLFSGRSENQDGCPGLWLAETFLTSPLQPLNRIQQNLTGSKISMFSTKFVFFRLIRKIKWPPIASDWLRYFLLLLLNHWKEFNKT